LELQRVVEAEVPTLLWRRVDDACVLFDRGTPARFSNRVDRAGRLERRRLSISFSDVAVLRLGVISQSGSIPDA